MTGKVVGTTELDDGVFGVAVNEAAMHMAVVQYLANQRQGTQSALTRAEVRGGGIKPRPQKGTGRSRQGSTNAPQWTGGGVVFAPKPRSYSFKVNRKLKRLALKSALTTKVENEKILVLDELKMLEIKTKSMKAVLNSLSVLNEAKRGSAKYASQVLVVMAEADTNIIKSAKNLPGVKTASVNTLNVYDILKYDRFVVTSAAAQKISEVYA
jgi:large subunit ribosomal protein L4